MSKHCLSDIAEFISEKIDLSAIKLEQYISTDNMLPDFNGIILSTSKPSLNKCTKFQEGDILFSNIRTYFKKVWFADFDGGCSPDVIVIRSRNKELVLPEFLYLLICSDEFINFTVMSSNGAKMPRGDKKAMLKYEFDIPTIEEQKTAIEHYFTLKEKIQLNTQINQTLEQIAQGIFKSWFVDFDPVRAKADALAQGKTQAEAELAAMQIISGKTPEELTALSQTQPEQYAELAEIARAFPSELEEIEGFGEVPRGWGYKIADELFDIGIGKTPPRKETEWFTTNSEDIPWISIKDMGNSGVFITESSEYLTPQAVKSFNIRKIPENVVLLSFKLTLGRVSITTCETTTNEAIAHFKVTDKSYLTTEYLYLFFKQFDFNSLGSTSSIATAVNSKTIKSIDVLVPTQEMIEQFQRKITDIFNQIEILTLENENLIKVRDFLLPRLLSGEKK